MRRHLREVAASALVIAAVIFAFGASAERSGHEEGAPHVDVRGSDVHVEGGRENSEAGHTDETAVTESTAHTESGEAKIFGVNAEANSVVAAVVVVSVLLAALLWFRPRREVWFIVGLFALALIDAIRSSPSGARSGCAARARSRYARWMAAAVASRSTPSTSYGSVAVMYVAALPVLPRTSIGTCDLSACSQ